MNVLMVTSEAVPYSKSGGLADVIGSLSPALKRKGLDVRILMPMYSFIDRKGFKESARFSVEMLGGTVEVSTVSKKTNGVEYIGLQHPYFTERLGIYGDTSFEPYPDNAERFTLLAKCAPAYVKATGWDADIIHCHDWTAGLVPFYVKKEKLRARTIFTIHNLAYQGDFSRYDAVLSGDRLPAEAFTGAPGSERLNMMHSALIDADAITTVSPTYAKEITTAELGCGMDGILRDRQDSLYGIINGLDGGEWNAAKDKFFSEHYTYKALDGKRALKARIQAENGLEVNPDIPLFAMISRIADQKGYAELLGGREPALEEILKRRMQLIVVGTGDKHYEDKLQEMAAVHDNLSVKIAFSNKVAHETEGAADFFLMPSRYEPCGLNQMYSLVYGTLPVAHRTGGLADTIIDITENPKEGTGFLFPDLSLDSILGGVDRALAFFGDKEGMEKAIRNAMRTDFSWDRSASEYIGLYSTLIR